MFSAMFYLSANFKHLCIDFYNMNGRQMEGSKHALIGLKIYNMVCRDIKYKGFIVNGKNSGVSL